MICILQVVNHLQTKIIENTFLFVPKYQLCVLKPSNNNESECQLRALVSYVMRSVSSIKWYEQTQLVSIGYSATPINLTLDFTWTIIYGGVLSPTYSYVTFFGQQINTMEHFTDVWSVISFTWIYLRCIDQMPWRWIQWYYYIAIYVKRNTYVTLSPTFLMLVAISW